MGLVSHKQPKTQAQTFSINLALTGDFMSGSDSRGVLCPD